VISLRVRCSLFSRLSTASTARLVSCLLKRQSMWRLRRSVANCLPAVLSAATACLLWAVSAISCVLWRVLAAAFDAAFAVEYRFIVTEAASAIAVTRRAAVTSR